MRWLSHSLSGNIPVVWTAAEYSAFGFHPEKYFVIKFWQESLKIILIEKKYDFVWNSILFLILRLPKTIYFYSHYSFFRIFC